MSTADERAVPVPDEPVAPARARVVVSALSDWIWVGLLLVLGLWVAARLGAFHLFGTVVASNGQRVRLPDAFATVDHPFHISRAEELLRALAAGHPLRWVGYHQGGYPVEFYPLGVAWLDVGLWAAFLGQLPIAAIHKLVIILIFLAPGLAYALMARRDRWPLGVALAALAVHVAVPGFWWSGGYMELVEWGLVTNVAANVALLFTLVWLTAYMVAGSRRAGAAAALAAAFSVYSNPRSAVALAVVGVGAWVALALRPRMDWARLRLLTGRLALVAVVAALVAAPEIVPLLRFRKLYYFVRYSFYATPADYIHSSIRAVSLPILLLGIGGVLAGYALPKRPVTRVAAVTLTLYVLATALLSAGHNGIVEQLETTRLMPFQRLLTIYLAAVAFYVAIRWLVAGLTSPQAMSDVLLIGATVVTLMVFVGGVGGVAAAYRGLYPIETSAEPSLADLDQAVKAADAAAPPGTAILVLGSTISWHEHFFAALQTERPLFFDDWLWYWQTRQPGPYDPQTEHAYDVGRIAETLTPQFLSEQGIGAIVATDTGRTGPIKEQASGSPNLARVYTGLFDAFVVKTPTDIVTFAGRNPTAITVNDQSLSASGASAGGAALIRRNWFPRWRATVNGKPAAITETADGYMSVAVPPGQVHLTLTYAVDTWDWFARAACVLGVLAVAGMFVFGRRRGGKAGKRQGGAGL